MFASRIAKRQTESYFGQDVRFANAMNKFDIVNALIEKNQCSRYLEICIPTTGQRFSRINRSGLSACHRLM